MPACRAAPASPLDSLGSHRPGRQARPLATPLLVRGRSSPALHREQAWAAVLQRYWNRQGVLRIQTLCHVGEQLCKSQAERGGTRQSLIATASLPAVAAAARSRGSLTFQAAGGWRALAVIQLGACLLSSPWPVDGAVSASKLFWIPVSSNLNTWIPVASNLDWTALARKAYNSESHLGVCRVVTTNHTEQRHSRMQHAQIYGQNADST
jgi:hypothetical protein